MNTEIGISCNFYVFRSPFNFTVLVLLFGKKFAQFSTSKCLNLSRTKGQIKILCCPTYSLSTLALEFSVPAQKKTSQRTWTPGRLSYSSSTNSKNMRDNLNTTYHSKKPFKLTKSFFHHSLKRKETC